MIEQRMREAMLDSFGMVSEGGQLNDLREAARRLIADDDFWKGLQRLADVRCGLRDMLADLKKPVKK